MDTKDTTIEAMSLMDIPITRMAGAIHGRGDIRMATALDLAITAVLGEDLEASAAEEAAVVRPESRLRQCEQDMCTGLRIRTSAISPRACVPASAERIQIPMFGYRLYFW